MTITTDPLTELDFRASSPASVKKTAARGQAAEFQRAMTEQHRHARKRLEKSIDSGESSILWSACQLGFSPADRELTQQIRGTKKQRRAGRNAAVEALTSGEFGPLQILVGIDTLVRTGRELSKSEYAALYTALSQVDDIEPESDGIDEHQQFVQVLICEGELPLLLSLALGDLRGRTARFKKAAEVLREGLDAGTDTDGMLHARLISQADVWLAPFVRSALWGSAFGNCWLTAKDTGRLSDTVRTCATLLIRTGLVSRPPSELRSVNSGTADIIEHGIRASGIRKSSPFASLARSHVRGRCKRAAAQKVKRSPQLATSNQSDWAESAILRSGIHVDSDLCVVNWDEPESLIHLAVLGIPLISGRWSSEVTVNGESIDPIEDWTCSCWFCDDEAAFLELESDVSESIQVVRQVMLSLQDHMAVVCETVTTGIADGEVRLRNQLPLAAEPLAVTNSITREIALHADGVSTRVIPAWLEDDRVQHAIGRCEKVDDMLVSEAKGLGGASIPLVLDWHPDRTALDADWNRLTVTEARAVIAAQSAAGFRVRIGKKQLLIYRSLRPADVPRAVMGLHTVDETIYGRVRKSGEVAPLVLVAGR